MGYVAAFVVSWLDRQPPPERLERRVSRALVPLWPLGGKTATWPPKYRLDFDGLDTLSDAVVSEGDVASGEGRPA
jgi:hypothetical protein